MVKILKAICFILIGIGLMLAYIQYDLMKHTEVYNHCYEQGFDYGTIVGGTGFCGYYTSRKPKIEL